uniref:Uncharacterized protein n=1 Tax=Arundo donax TaxID=35708 RepID=A0A0A9FPS6_ARUDO
MESGCSLFLLLFLLEVVGVSDMAVTISCFVVNALLVLRS